MILIKKKILLYGFPQRNDFVARYFWICSKLMNRYFKNDNNYSSQEVSDTCVFFMLVFLCQRKNSLAKSNACKKGNISNSIPQLQNGFCCFGQSQVLKEFQKNISSYNKSFGPQRKRKGKVAYDVK